jgi:hypothetical protein
MFADPRRPGKAARRGDQLSGRAPGSAKRCNRSAATSAKRSNTARRVTQDFAAKRVGDDHACFRWQDVEWHVSADAKIKPVAMGGVVAPLAVSAEVGDRRLDFNDQQRALTVDADHVGATTVGKRQFDDTRVAARPQQPPHAPRNRQRALGLAAIERRARHVSASQRRRGSSPQPSRRSSSSARWCCRT